MNQFNASAWALEHKSFVGFLMVLLSLAGLFSAIVRELPEVQYQLQRPFILDSSLTEQTFGLKPAPLEDLLLEMTANA